MPELNAKQREREDRAIAYLAAGRSTAETAALLGISVTTLYRLSRSALFQARLHEARNASLAALVKTCEDAAPNALQQLIALSDGPLVADAVRLRASREVLDIMLKLKGESEVLPRLASLEVMLTERGRESPVAPPPPEAFDDLEDEQP